MVGRNLSRITGVVGLLVRVAGRLRMLALEFDGHSYVIRGRLWFPFVLSGIVLNSLLRSTVLC